MGDPDTRPTTGKGARLAGGALTDEALESSAAVLHHTGLRHAKGLQQYFATPELASFSHDVMNEYRHSSQPAVLDPTAGNGALLAAFQRAQRYGVEIDADQIAAGDYTAIHGDLQRVYPLLRAAGASFPRIAVNPPFGLTWLDPRTNTQRNATEVAFSYAVELLRADGQGMLIAGVDRFRRDIESMPEARGVYCTVQCPDLFDGVKLPLLLAFFVRPELRRDGDMLRLEAASRTDLASLTTTVRAHCKSVCGHVSSFHPDETETFDELMASVQREHDQRRQARVDRDTARFDFQIVNGKVRCHLSRFAKLALAKRKVLREVEALNGKAVEYFALNLPEWRMVERAARDDCLQLHPDSAASVAQATEGAVRDATPLYPIKPQMRLGFLEDLESIRCTKSDADRGYYRGETYSLQARSKVEIEHDTKLVENRKGELEPREVERERKLLELTIGGTYPGRTFDESAEAITYVLDHFDVPDPGDIGTRFPDELARALRVLDDIEAEFLKPRGLAFYEFQRQDLARMLVKGKAPLGWDTGLGKTLGELTWAEACVRYWGAQPAALFAMPQDLLRQFNDEAMRFFGRKVELIETQADAKRIARHVRRGGAGWYATYYEALSRVGIKNEALPLQVFPAKPCDGRADDRISRKPIMLNSDEFCPVCQADTYSGWRANACANCGYVHKRLKVPSIASILASAFKRGVIVVDELSEIQGDQSLRGQAIRGFRGGYRLGGTATAVSNFINSAFHPLGWNCGYASPRFPYAIDDKRHFEREFCVIEYMLGAEGSENEGQRQRAKILPAVTNVSKLWRLVATNMVRRRKEDCGVPIVARNLRPIEVPMGENQRRLHLAVMKNFGEWFTETHPDSPLVRAKMVRRFAAACGMIPKLEYVATLPEADPDAAWWQIPATNWTPATLKVLELALTAVRGGEKVLVGSPLVETGPFLADALSTRRVHALHIVERHPGRRAQTKTPKKRAAALHAFKHGEAQVLCCGVQAVSLGHNMDHVSTVIMHGLPKTWKALKQFVDRAWRLTSKRDVNVHIVIPRQSITTRWWELVINKGAAEDLAFDGQLIEKPEPQISWTEVLRAMTAAGVQPAGDEVPESNVLQTWQNASGPFAAIGSAPPPPPPARPRPANVAELPAQTDKNGQLTFDLAA